MATTMMKYNPAFLDDEALIQSFVARHVELDLILEIIRENTVDANQHILLIGPRGIGKTTLALRVAAEIRAEEDLQTAWYPVVYGEESYGVTSPGEFWLEALFHLGDQTQESQWLLAYEELRTEPDETRLRQRALAQLMDFADEQDVRLMLVVENLNMLVGAQMSGDDAWTLRHTLMNEPRLMLLGTATSRFKEVDDYNQALYDLFKIIELDPLDDREAQAVWREITGTAPALEQMRPIQILTGGNPRLIRIISDFAADTSFQDLMTNLIHLVDEHTEYFKNHLDGLAPQERKVFVALADLWDPSSARTVAEAARLDVNKTSALLKRLVERGAATVFRQEKRTKYYQVAERMYNIYHLMRRRGQVSSRVRAVVRFMIHLYKDEALIRTTASLAEEVCALPTEARQDLFQAYEAILDMTPEPALKSRIVAETGHLFASLPDTPASVQQLIAASQAEVQPDTSELTEEEKEALLKLQVEEVEDVGTLVKLGNALSEEPDRLEEAEASFRKAIEIDPGNYEPWAKLGWLFTVKLERHAEGLDAYDRAIEIDSTHSWVWSGKGYAMYQLGRCDEAIMAFERVIDLDPTDVYSWSTKGYALYKLEHYEDALQAFDHAIELNANYAYAWNGKGDVLKHFGHYEEALSAYERGIELDPTRVGPWGGKGGSLFHLERYEEALNAYERAIELDPDKASRWYSKGIALRGLGRYEEALKTHEHAIELDSNYVAAWNGKGEALTDLGRYSEAIEAHDRAIDLSPDLAFNWLKKGIALGYAGRYKEAREAYQKVIASQTDRNTVWEARIVGLLLVNWLLEKPDKTEEDLDIEKFVETLLQEIPEEALDIALMEYLLPLFETIARRDVENTPEAGHFRFILARNLGLQEKWMDALEHADYFLKDTEVTAKSLDEVIDFFIEAAAADHAAEALKHIQASPSAEDLEPLAVALQLYQGEQVDVALEIQEVAKDVVKRIEARREAMQEA